MNEQCLKLTAYFGERQRAVGGAGRFLADAMLDLFGSHNVATSVMLRGTTSFGPKHEFRCDQSLSLSTVQLGMSRRHRWRGQGWRARASRVSRPRQTISILFTNTAWGLCGSGSAARRP